VVLKLFLCMGVFLLVCSKPTSPTLVYGGAN
jgi:hypothetical protein